MALFGGKKKSSVGIDIGTSSIKIAELSQKTGGGVELTNYGEYSADAGSTLHSSSVKLSATEASSIIQQIMQEAKIVETGVAMSVPIFSGFSTLISLPNMPDEELEQTISFEAKKYIPLPLTEVQFEWVRVSNNGDKGQEKNADVLIVAVTNELINKYSSIAKLSNLELKYLELDVFSLARSLLAKDDRSVLIVDIGSQTSILSIVDGAWPVFTRSIDVSGAEFSKVISSSLGIDFARAEEMKKEEGVNVGEGIILPLLDSIFSEGKRIINDYAAKKSGSKVILNKVIVSGGSAMMPGLLDYAKKTLGKEVVIGFPFHDIIYPKILEPTLRELAPTFDVAVGLALRELK